MDDGQTATVPELIQRRWLPISPQARPECCSPPLRILQWNMLADGLAQAGNFTRVDPALLSWEYRAPLVEREIASAAADIVCMQECTYSWLDPIMRRLGYSGVHLEKPRSIAGSMGYPPDGVAVFFRPRFSLARPPLLSLYSDPDDGREANTGYVILDLRDEQAGGRDLVVATTHLKAKTGFDAVRAHQAAQLLRRLEQHVGALPIRAAGDPPPGVLLTGDFNCEPSSQPCAAVNAAGLTSMWDVLEGAATCFQPRSDDDHGDDGGVAAPSLPLTCAPFTTWKYRESGEALRTIDYVWHRQQHLSARAVWQMPTQAAIGDAGLPCAGYPSDHLSVGMEFTWADAASAQA